MSDLISAPTRGEIPTLLAGTFPSDFAGRHGLTEGPLDAAELAVFNISALTGATQEQVETWSQLRDLYIPTIILISDLESAEMDFDDMAAIIGKQLDPVVTPFLVLHDDAGLPAALIDLDSLKIHNYVNGEQVIQESDPEHKVLVFEFRKEYLEALEAGGDDAFVQALLFPALPYSLVNGLGTIELDQYLALLPSSS